MRASRLLRMLLLLQNRGRMTSAALARELEVARRTVLRDVDALTEAGLPIVTYPGADGGIELAFNYRTRLTGLSDDEAEAMAVILSVPLPELEVLGLQVAGERARVKVFESFEKSVRDQMTTARCRFGVDRHPRHPVDVRVKALAKAVRGKNLVHILEGSADEKTIQPISLTRRMDGWFVRDALDPDQPIAVAACGGIRVSAHTF